MLKTTFSSCGSLYLKLRLRKGRLSGIHASFSKESKGCRSFSQITAAWPPLPETKHRKTIIFLIQISQEQMWGRGRIGKKRKRRKIYGKKEEEEKNLEQNKRKIRRGDAWINPCLVIWREMFNFILNFSPNFSLCTLFLLSLIKHVQNPNPKAVHYGDNLSILSLERI